MVFCDLQITHQQHRTEKSEFWKRCKCACAKFRLWKSLSAKILLTRESWQVSLQLEWELKEASIHTHIPDQEHCAFEFRDDWSRAVRWIRLHVIGFFVVDSVFEHQAFPVVFSFEYVSDFSRSVLTEVVATENDDLLTFFNRYCGTLLEIDLLARDRDLGPCLRLRW